MLEHVRSRTHHTHITHQYIKELRKFIEVCFSHESSHPGDARIVLGRLLQVGFLVHPHAPEFNAIKGFSVLPASLLNKKDGPAGVSPDEKGKNRHQPGEYQYDNQAAK